MDKFLKKYNKELDLYIEVRKTLRDIHSIYPFTIFQETFNK